mgnify:FL=1
MKIKPETIVVVDDNVAIKWDDNSESLISNKIMRDKCPCANCSGESDVFGNIYKSNNPQLKNNRRYILNRYMNIGHYAIRIIWGDGHNAGIYSFEFLKTLGDNK